MGRSDGGRTGGDGDNWYLYDEFAALLADGQLADSMLVAPCHSVETHFAY
ncbi:hypothetical protein PR003_g30301 [Phytophthora rubi]|uniref:Uncharacterized protein n=1 Tax=Phytophthora rubi TaxID=129364 RepID=A0A6A4BB95_9STRA|nr:hypothetical protein PR003_g30301 [Phytophthora rubi]